jgi:hypothetical protein
MATAYIESLHHDRLLTQNIDRLTYYITGPAMMWLEENPHLSLDFLPNKQTPTTDAGTEHIAGTKTLRSKPNNWYSKNKWRLIPALVSVAVLILSIFAHKQGWL